MRHDTDMHESWHTYECVPPRVYRQVAPRHMNESCHTCECVMSLIGMGHATYMNEPCDTDVQITKTDPRTTKIDPRITKRDLQR